MKLTWLSLTRSTEYRTFLALNVYRVAVGLLLVGLRSPDSNQVLNPTFFHWLTFGYGTTGFFLALTPKRFVTHTFNRYILRFDILFTAALLALNYGSGSGMALVLLPMLTGVAVAAQGRQALQDAGLATVLILSVEVWVQYRYGIGQFWHAIGAGLSYLATALLAERQGAMLQAQRAVVEQQGADLANLEQLNQQIIQDMPTGMVVVDEQGHPYRYNHQAERLLGCWETRNTSRTHLNAFSPALSEFHERWCAGESMEGASFLVSINQRLLHPRWIPLKQGRRDQGAVIYLEDMGEIKAHAQRMKLAALGRLTANIAHEIRNPLSSIRYAAELLHEQQLPIPNTTDPGPGHTLTRIIVQNVQRINHIVEEVMQLNQRDRAQPERLDLAEVITELLDEKAQTNELPREAVQLDIAPQLDVWCDRFHFERILWNLISNAWRHSQHQPGSIRLDVRLGYTQEVSVINVIDDGPGIGPEQRSQLFEPFATTHRQGNGLGLYIARELTEANHGTLECLSDDIYRPALTSTPTTEHPAQGAHFRIILPRHPLHTKPLASETVIS